MDDAPRARRGLLLFFAALIPLSGAVQAAIVLRVPRVSRAALILALMWVPALASLIARLANREGFRDLSPRLGGKRGALALLIAVLFPLVTGAVAYGIAWRAGLAPFEAPEEDPALLLPLWMVPLSGSPAARFLQSLGIHLTIGAVSGCVFAAGEEIGWRGYLAPRLLDARVRGAIPLSGLVWAVWHFPLALGHKSEHPLRTLALFTVLVIPMGGLMARMRLESGSIWGPIVLHGLWNELLGIVFAGFTPKEGIWLGESGILVVATSTLLCVPLLRGRWPYRRAPGDEPHASVSFLGLDNTKTARPPIEHSK